MNLFYLLGTNNYLVDSNLDITLSLVHVSKTEGVCLYPYMLSFQDGGSDGVQCQTLDISSFVLGSDVAGGFKYYTDFVLVDNICNFTCESFALGNPPIIASRDVTNSSFVTSIVLDTVVWTGITYGNGIYCIVGSSGANEITIGTSVDKITWSYNTLTTLWAASTPKIVFGNGIFILADGSIYKSTSGTSWDMVYDDPIYGWDDVEYCNQGFIAYNGSVSCTSVNGITWSLHTLPSIIGADATVAYWENIVSNGDILCMKSSPDIIDSTTGMSSISFSNDGGLSWMTQTLLDGADQGIVSLSVPKFWEQFIKTTES